MVFTDLEERKRPRRSLTRHGLATLGGYEGNGYANYLRDNILLLEHLLAINVRVSTIDFLFPSSNDW